MLQTPHRNEPVVAGIGTRQNTPRQRWLHDWELGAEGGGRARHPCAIGRSGIAGFSIAIFNLSPLLIILRLRFAIAREGCAGSQALQFGHVSVPRMRSNRIDSNMLYH